MRKTLRYLITMAEQPHCRHASSVYCIRNRCYLIYVQKITIKLKKNLGCARLHYALIRSFTIVEVFITSFFNVTPEKMLP